MSLPTKHLVTLLKQKNCKQVWEQCLDDGSFLRCYTTRKGQHQNKFVVHMHLDLTFDIFLDTDGKHETDKIEVLRSWLNHEEPERPRLSQSERQQIQIHAIINYFLVCHAGKGVMDNILERVFDPVIESSVFDYAKLAPSLFELLKI